MHYVSKSYRFIFYQKFILKISCNLLLKKEKLKILIKIELFEEIIVKNFFRNRNCFIFAILISTNKKILEKWLT